MDYGNTTFIIEDNPGDLLILKDQLKTAGWCTEFNKENFRLSDAVEDLKTIKPVVVFLDLNLPDSNGLETFLAIQEMVPDVPIIILSGMNDTSLSLQAVQAGAQDFLVKGEFEEKLLLKTILYSIERKKTQLKLEEANRRFSYASKATNDALWDWDMKSNEFFWNDKVKIFGYHDAVRKNKSWRLNNIHPVDKKRITAKMNELINNSIEQWSEQYRFRCADGSYKYIHDRGYILRDRNNQPNRMIGTMQDITGQVMLQKKLEEEREQKQKDILRAAIESQEKERNEIGKELHDSVTQILATANIYLSLARKDNEIRTLELVQDSRNLINKAIEEIRNLSHALVSSHIDNVGLVVSVEHLINNMHPLQIVKVDFKHKIEDHVIHPMLLLTVYRIIQEQMNNVFKHARASKVSIDLRIKNDTIKLHISDDGIGTANYLTGKGIGLSNIRNRVNTYNGNVVFETSPGNGFKVTVELPLKLPANKN